MNYIKKNIVIDLRPIQKFRYNGVCIASKLLIQQLIKDHSHKANFILITTGFKHKDTNISGNYKHIHLYVPNIILNLIFKFKLLSWNNLLNLQIDTYFCPDLRLSHTAHDTKHIQYIHDLAYLKYKQSLSLKSRIHYFLLNTNEFLQNIDTVLTNSNFSKQEIKKIYRKKIKIINLGLKKPKTYKQTNKKGYILISSLHERKALEYIQTFNEKINKLKEPINIYGIQEPNFKKNNLPNAKNIKYHGALDEKNKNQTIQKHKALLYFSRYEGFGLPILEGLNNKVPVISNKIKTFYQLHKNQINYIESLKDLKSLKKGNNKFKNQLKKASLQLWKQLTCKNMKKVL